MFDVDETQFELLVGVALDRIPEDIAGLMDNVIIIIEEDPPADDPGLLGLYTGVPLTERGSWYAGALPDQITVFRNPTLAIANSLSEIVEEIEITIVHEIAHHFGIDDDRLHELGYE